MALMNNVMRTKHKMWRICPFQCGTDICTMTELRKAHDSSLDFTKKADDDLELVIKGFQMFIKERTFGNSCEKFGRKFLKRQKRISRKLNNRIN